ncbi:MAG: asparagine synthase (glutamine-hydrolyzing) [Chitinophagales bacterium]|nr:asparagine synthase (glutamine-hydrolyzing) [Chitinophagales bacterium]MDW8394137.1 asparagine synthase (glutamine-hydrolyzing) [Chitinophagales bacterium]
MCGISGIICLTPSASAWQASLQRAVELLRHRGPDATGTFSDGTVAFGHCRLSVIDISEAANQPMQSGEVVITYNGEIFNYRDLRRELEQQGAVFQTQSDTEVLLRLFERQGMNMLHRLNGFFAFALYDRQQRRCWLVRDRFGVKPLYYYADRNVVAFASELDALLQWPVPRVLDEVSLVHYLQLNYIPAPHSICKNVRKLLPGTWLQVDAGDTTEIVEQRWYALPHELPASQRIRNYEEACSTLFDLLSDSVRQRLVSDVPLGVFLSGGIDSSIVAGLASRHMQRVRSFSVGFSDDEFFDETPYARLVARHFQTDHTVFSFGRKQLAEAALNLLEHPGEPFADSSAILVFLLSKSVRPSVKVALSGDGADELFGGYLKHVAEYRIRNPLLVDRFLLLLAPLLSVLPQSRNNWWQNRLRQIQRFAAGNRLPATERYWRWCTLASEAEAYEVLRLSVPVEEERQRRRWLTRLLANGHSLEQVLRTDVAMVLPDDMLMKVDRCSMAHGLEVRNPFLDYRIAEFAFRIPDAFKVDRRRRKKIVHDAFRSLLPEALYHRPKKGFEVPLHSLLTAELRGTMEEVFHPDFLRQQGLFDVLVVSRLRQKLGSANPGDSAARLWGLLVFQHWWRRHLQ